MCAGAHMCVSHILALRAKIFTECKGILNFMFALYRDSTEDHNFATSLQYMCAGAHMCVSHILALRAKIVILVAMSTDFVPKFSVWMW